MKPYSMTKCLYKILLICISAFICINSSIIVLANDNSEKRSVWITFLEYSSKGYTKKAFTDSMTEKFDYIADNNFNTVYVHVRPFADAMYKSKYFPWSKYASGKQGKSPKFDPLKIMVRIAHERGLKIHAFINPYRISKVKDFSGIAKSNPAYKWLHDDDPDNDRNVLRHGKLYYFNPASDQVISLINNGVREIVENYDVDGVIFDDYFYPNLGKNYKKNFDYNEYKEYVEVTDSPMSIVEWRRDNIAKMLKKVHTTVKETGKNQLFGISPAGNINNLLKNNSYYLDVNLICGNEGYIDYIEPQQYWGFEHSIVPFDENIQGWIETVSYPSIKLYFALPMHNVQVQPSSEWKENSDIISRMIEGLRENQIDGFSIFRYAFLTEDVLTKNGAMEELENLKYILN